MVADFVIANVNEFEKLNHSDFCVPKPGTRWFSDGSIVQKACKSVKCTVAE